jgi:hypothetical protein
MYRINLHPEYVEHRRRARQRLVHTIFFSTLLGLQLLLVGSLILSAFLLEEQVRILGTAVPRLDRSVSGLGAPAPERDVARRLFAVRQERIEWSPMLAALADEISDSLAVVRIEGEVASPRDPAGLLIQGRSEDPQARLGQVTRFIDGLRGDARLADRFPEIRLGTIKGDQAGQFQVICTPPGGGG